MGAALASKLSPKRALAKARCFFSSAKMTPDSLRHLWTFTCKYFMQFATCILVYYIYLLISLSLLQGRARSAFIASPSLLPISTVRPTSRRSFSRSSLPRRRISCRTRNCEPLLPPTESRHSLKNCVLRRRVRDVHCRSRATGILCRVSDCGIQ